MNALIRSEVLKIRSTQVWFWMVLLSVAFTALGSIGLSYDASHSDSVNYYALFTQSQNAGVALLVLGLLGLTTEFRHKTITPTLLATPNRWRMLAGKAASYVLFSVVFAVLCVLVNFAIVITWLSIAGVRLEYGHGVAGGVGKAFLSLVLLGLFGLGLGGIIRNQAAAMVFGIVYLFVLDPLLSFVPGVRKGYAWTPGGALRAFTSHGTVEGLPGDVHLPGSLAAGLLLLAWAVALVVLGGRFSLQRDIS